jgi:hypothetical protein
MKKLKEAVKAGEMSASDALADLDKRARANGDTPYVYETRTWKWLKRRTKDAVA